MQLNEKLVSEKNKESRAGVPSVVQPLKLSRRLDSSRASERDGKLANLVAATPNVEAGELVLTAKDRRTVDEAASWISEKIAATLKRGAQEVGEYVLEMFFANDARLARSRNPHKNASFRALAEKCGTPQLPISKSWLHNAVGVALMIRELPETARSFKDLLPSYQEALLPLRDPARVEKLATDAVVKDLSLRDLRRAVAEEKSKAAKHKHGRGRPPLPPVVKALGRALRLFSFEGGRQVLTRTGVEALNDEQRKCALEATEELIDKLKDLFDKLKAAR